MDEIWDVYDAAGNKTGRTAKRVLPLAKGDYHLVVHIWIKNAANQWLIQKRADNLEWSPGWWAATGGSVVAGEDSLTGAIRETEEEIGVTLKAEQLQHMERITRSDSIIDVWLAEAEVNLADCVLEDAVTEIKWVSTDELKQMHHNHIFVDYRFGEMYSPELYKDMLGIGEA